MTEYVNYAKLEISWNMNTNEFKLGDQQIKLDGDFAAGEQFFRRIERMRHRIIVLENALFGGTTKMLDLLDNMNEAARSRMPPSY